MKNIGLTELISELQQQKATAKDYLVTADAIKFKYGKLYITDLASGSLTDTANYQLADKLGIPFKYLQRCYNELENNVFSTSAISIYDDNCNYWLNRYTGKPFLVRMLIKEQTASGLVRAILSDRYKIIDNYDLAITSLQAIQETGLNIKIDTADLTIDNMYIRFINPDVELQAKGLLKYYKSPFNNKQDSGIISGFIIRNSETGKSSYRFNPRIIFKACNNGLITADETLNYVHLGSKNTANNNIEFSLETRQKELEFIKSELADAIKTVCSKEYLESTIQRLYDNNISIYNPVKAIQNIGTALTLTKKQTDDLINIFTISADVSAFGLMQSITAFSQSVIPELRYKLEKQAFNIFKDAKKYDYDIAEIKPELN